jgi:hypothetical protein
MDEQVWFDNPKILFDVNKVLKFWPNRKQTAAERVNSSTRFILYAASILYLTRKDPRILVLALMVIAVIYVLYKGNMVKEGVARPMFSHDQDYMPNCQLPTEDNPMGNVLISDIGDNPNRSPACYYPTVKPLVEKYLDNTIPYDCGRSRCAMPDRQRKTAARQFITGPVTTIPGDQTGFAEWCYGKKFSPMCKSDPTVCNPDARGVQLEAFAGLDPSGDKRSGMSRGTPGNNS